jgi:hypothetical protein
VQGLGGTANGDGVSGIGQGNSRGVVGTGSGSGAGLIGTVGNTNGVGVKGFGASFGSRVEGTGGANNASIGVKGTGGSAGVAGFAASSTGDGVFGGATAGKALYGSATDPAGVGVLAENTAGGTALQVSGPALFSRSGTVSIAFPAKSATVSGVPLTASSLILATAQNSNVGVSILSAVPNVAGARSPSTLKFWVFRLFSG